MIIRNALVYTEDHVFQKRDILIKGANFAEICPAGTTPCCDEKIVDASGCFAIPGLVDLHFHGCAGFDFSDGTEEAMHAIAAYEASVGVTSIIPATMTLGESQLQAICGTAAQYVKVQRQGEATLRGIHMEGPFFSIKKKGAQNPEHLRNPDIEMFRRLNQTSDGQIRIVSIAPELDGAMEFIEALRDETVISIAHTDADYETARLAIEHGVQHITHLYNAMPPFLHRAPGPIGAAADCKSCMVELICDGIHVHSAVVRSTFRMFGDDRIILISDSMRATGLQDGTYDLGGLSVTVCGQSAMLADGTIAGSVTNLIDCVRIAVQQMGIPLEAAVRCATENPAKSVGIYQWCGSISPGKRADVVLLSQDDLRLQQVILGGQQF